MRVNIDIAGYKKQRNERLAEQTQKWIEEVLSSGKEKHLDSMNAAERRIVHHTVNESSKVESGSEGEGRDRHVVIRPKA